jgi:YidC/Oxa1 family membrane protein insertase
MNFFDVILIHPMLNILVAFYQLLMWFHIPYALGFSIILLTVAIRLIMYPFMHISIKQQKKMQDLQPHINKLKEKHKNDMKAQQLAQMELFKEHGVNPASGCLIAIVQIPFFIALYNVLLKTVHLKTPEEINNQLYFVGLRLTHLWDPTFFGLPLGQTPQQLFSKVGIAIVLVSVITGGLQMIQSKMMMASSPVAPYAPEPTSGKKKEDDFATSLQKQMMFMMPLMIGFFAFTLPFGLSLYWNTLTIFGIIQQYLVGGWGGLTDWIKVLNKKS